MWHIILCTISVIGILFSLYLATKLQQALEGKERLMKENTKLKAESKSLRNRLKSLSDKICELEELLDLYIEEQFKQKKWPTF